MRQRNRVKHRFTNSILWRNNRFHGWTEDRRLERMFQSYLESFPEDLKELETLSVKKKDEKPGYAELYLTHLCLEDWKSRKQQKLSNSPLSSEEIDSLTPTDNTKQSDLQGKEKRQSQTKQLVRQNIVKQFISHNLEAYLQVAIYKVANKLNNQYQNHSTFRNYTIQDYFDLGILLLYQKNILEKYDFAINSNIEAYTYTRLEQRITGELRRQDKSTGKTGEYLLLEEDSKTEQRMIKALLWQGVEGDRLDEYIFVWDIYREIRRQTKKVSRGKTQPPTESDWNAIHQEIRLSNPNFNHNIETIKEWINECRKALRQYLSPSAVSLENPVSQSVDNLAFKDVLEDSKYAEKIKTREEISERRGIASNLENWIFEEFTRLKAESEKLRIEPEFKLILDMQHGLQMTQAEIANHLNSAYPEIAERISRNGVAGQSQVSRKITKVKGILSKRTIEYMKETKFLLQSGIEVSFEKFKDTYLENFIKNFDTIFSSIMNAHYNSLDWDIYEWLKNKIASLNDEQKLFLELFYTREMAIVDICSQMEKAEPDILKMQSEIINNFVNDYTDFSNTQLKISWSDKETDLTSRLIDRWLRTYYSPESFIKITSDS